MSEPADSAAGGDLVDACRALVARIAAAGESRAALRLFESECTSHASLAYQQGRADLAVALLSPLAEAGAGGAPLFFLLALAHREEQDLDAARVAAAKAAAADPQNPDIAFAHAQFAFENWRPAARLFRDAQRLAPKNLEITRNAAAALVAEGQAEAAIKILTRAVSENPQWLEGRRQIAKHQALRGCSDEVSASFRAACRSNPQDLSLRLAWFHAEAQKQDWTVAREVIEEGAALMGEQRGFAIARAYIAAESGDAAAARPLLDALDDVDDPGLDLCRVRFFLREGEADRAEAVAARHIDQPTVRSFWPYLSLAWRLQGDDRAEWLDRPDAFIKSYDLALDADFLGDLAATLRTLHRSKAPYLEQSVRGGTQTDRNLFFNSDRFIQAVRKRIVEAVRTYINELPPADPAHPLLAVRRDRIRFAGAWSVRLGPQGRHRTHTHTDGWISSALYVASPTASELGAPPAGWLGFGEAPTELGLSLPAYRTAAPDPGRLVLFPSTMWHGTTPFPEGERLTIAFDVGAPQSR